jgi:hypothetical protein
VHGRDCERGCVAPSDIAPRTQALGDGRCGHNVAMAEALVGATAIPSSGAIGLGRRLWLHASVLAGEGPLTMPRTGASLLRLPVLGGE